MLSQVVVGNLLLLLQKLIHLFLLLAQLVEELRCGQAVADVVQNLLLDSWPLDISVLSPLKHLLDHQNLRVHFEHLGVFLFNSLDSLFVDCLLHESVEVNRSLKLWVLFEQVLNFLELRDFAGFV